MELWIPDQAGRGAVGELPDDVRLNVFARKGPPPDVVLNAEFLVPSHATRGLLELLPRMESLAVIQALSAGIDWLMPAVPRGVTLCNARGTRDGAVAEWVIAALLALTKNLPELQNRQLEHQWQWTEPGDLAGRRVMILGYGSIGKAVERRLKGFDVEIIRVARQRRRGVYQIQELPALLTSTEVLVVLLPFTAETEGLLSENMLARLPPGALVINAARGGIVENAGLLTLLQAGRLRAALDVTDPEPLPEDHPLWDAPGVLITPHVAGDSPAASRNAFALVGDQVRRYVRGEQLANVVEHRQ